MHFPDGIRALCPLVVWLQVGKLVGAQAPVEQDSVTGLRSTPKRVSFISVNDVYKLVGLPGELAYFYLNAGLDYVDATAASKCDGSLCGLDASDCGKGDRWEACFPLSFGRAKELSLKRPAESGVHTFAGPCVEPADAGARNATDVKYGGLVDFGATFKWLKEDATAAGDLAIGTLAGDFIGPSYLAEIFKGQQLVEIMNHMGVDLVNIGNHDVDYKLPNLREQMSKSAFHYLNANLDDSQGADIHQPMVDGTTIEGNVGSYDVSEWRRLHILPGSRVGKGWAMLDRSGVRVCVLGTTDIDKMNWAGKKVKGRERDIPAALAILRQWEQEALGCTLRIAMTHTRTGNDLNLFRAAEHAGLHLDAIIAGHDHYALYAELARGDNGTTYLVKAGADARAVSRLTFDVSGERPVGRLEAVPVVSGGCGRSAQGPERQAWLRRARQLAARYVSRAEEADAQPLNVLYRGVYDTNGVRDAETRAVSMWLDLMRQSAAGDVLFFQAGLVRQDMFQDFASGIPLSQLFMLEEFPWGDEDPDARSSLFPFKVTLADLVTRTLPFVAKKYWCRAPFNDANRMHVSGLVVEMVNVEACDSPATGNPVRSVTLVGNCHQGGALQSLDSGCCRSPLCGRLWSAGDWDARVTEAMRQEPLTVLTGQVCVPSKYGSHGPGFHEVGMLCRGAEPPENWGSGADFARSFQGAGVAPPHDPTLAAPDFQRFGYYFKPAMLRMLRSRSQPLLVGSEGASECGEARQLYEAGTFYRTCLCELRVPDTRGCTAPGRHNGFPRFLAAPLEAFGKSVPGDACNAGEGTCGKVTFQ